MLKKLGISITAFLAMMGVAFAGDGQSQPASDGMTDKGILPISGKLPVGYRVPLVAFGRQTKPPTQVLRALMSIAPCSGTDCPKKFRFVLTCKTDGPKLELQSPWYDAVATKGMIVKQFSFQDPQVARCDAVKQITLETEKVLEKDIKKTPDKGSLPIAGLLPVGFRMPLVVFGRQDDNIQKLRALMSIAPCFGPDCPKTFRFVLMCETDPTSPLFEIRSPWYKVMLTPGMVTREFSFRDPLVPMCRFVRKITVESGF